jgi:hypothetical protein
MVERELPVIPVLLPGAPDEPALRAKSQAPAQILPPRRARSQDDVGAVGRSSHVRTASVSPAFSRAARMAALPAGERAPQPFHKRRSGPSLPGISRG